MTTAIGMAGQDPKGEGPYTPRPSITNILSVMDEGFLPEYYAKLVAEHAVQNFGSIRFMAEKFGVQTAVNALKAIPSRPNPAAAIGDEVHAAIDVLHTTDVITTEFATTTARQMFAQYRHFVSEERPVILASEFTVWSYDHGYAGTGDLLWAWRDCVWVIDTKTGTRCYPKVGMQCAALANGDVILDDQGNEHPVPRAGKLGVLHIRPRSCKLYELQHVDEAFQAFLGLKACFDWRRFCKDSTIPEAPVSRTEFRAA